MASPQFATVVQLTGSQIAFPINRQMLPFTPDTLIVNNRSNCDIQVGPAQQGPFQLCSNYSITTMPWTWGASVYVLQLGTSLPVATDFLEIDAQATGGSGQTPLP